MDLLDVGRTEMWVLKDNVLTRLWVRAQPAVGVAGGLTAFLGSWGGGAVKMN